MVDVASEQRKAALQSVVALLPDENRQALHCLLLFLNRLADYAADNQVQSPFTHSLVTITRPESPVTPDRPYKLYSRLF